MFRHRFDVGTMLCVFELNVKNPAFAQHQNNLNARSFYVELHFNCVADLPVSLFCWISIIVPSFKAL